jgi:hypothetical protein
VGIRTRVHTMERATFLTAWREHKIRGVIMGLGAPAGNAATRIEVYVAKNGIYASGVVPEIEDLYQRQARELGRRPSTTSRASPTPRPTKILKLRPAR